MVHYLAGQLSSALAITTQTVVKPAAGKLVTVTVSGTAGTTTIDDAATVGGIGAGTKIATLTALGVYQFNFPFLNGLIITPGTATVSVSFE